MQPAALAFRRAQKLTQENATRRFAVHALAVLESLVFLAMLAIGGLIIALIVSRGVARIAEGDAEKAPRWLEPELPAEPKGEVVLTDTGLYPIVAHNQSPPSPPWHRLGARVVKATLNLVEPLRSNIRALPTLLATGVALLLLLALIRLVRRRLAVRLVSDAAATLRRQIHRQIYRLGQSSLPTEGSGPAVNLFSRDVNDVRDGLLTDLDTFLRLPILAGGLILIAFFLSFKLTVFLVSLGALCWFLARPMDRSAQQEANAAARDAAVQLCLLQEDLGMVRTVRVYGMESIDKERFDEHLRAHQQAEARRLLSEPSASPTTTLLYAAAATLATGLLGYVVLEGGSSRLSPAAMVALVVALLGLRWPVMAWLARRPVLRQAGRSALAIFEYLDRRPELLQNVGAQFLAPLKNRITFENVSLESGSGRTLLSGISADIRAGTRTAIVSLEEGSKLAVACLIPRLIDPKSGIVRMDGTDLREITLESIRAQVAIVLQADLTFSDSVVANIGLGDPSYGLPRIIEAAKVAHAHNFIQDLPDGYETVIGPLGHYLSPDEQYRIALARAYLHDPSIVVIEEPTTPMDEDVKHMVDDTIDRLAMERTLIFLPHRLSTIRKCDQVIVLHSGRVESIGPPRDLNGQSKLYRHIQYVEFNQFATGEIEAGQMGG